MKSLWITDQFHIETPRRRGLKSLAATLLLAACAPTALAQETVPVQETAPAEPEQYWQARGNHVPPRWSLEIRAGKFEPELEDWETFYGDEQADQLGLALAYKFLRQAEIGLAIDSVHEKGSGLLPLSGTPGGEVDFQMYPAHLYLLLRGVFFENQWVVPYVGGGATRVYYRQEIDNQPSVRGKVEGDHSRAGLQILLDWLDPGNAAGFEEESVNNTYLYVERLSFSAEIDGIELGGESEVFGLVFEF